MSKIQVEAAMSCLLVLSFNLNPIIHRKLDNLEKNTSNSHENIDDIYSKYNHLQNNPQEFLTKLTDPLYKYLNKDYNENICGVAAVATAVEIMKSNQLGARVGHVTISDFLNKASLLYPDNLQNPEQLFAGHNGAVSVKKLFGLIQKVGKSEKLWNEVNLVHGDPQMTSQHPISSYEMDSFIDNFHKVKTNHGLSIIRVLKPAGYYHYITVLDGDPISKKIFIVDSKEDVGWKSIIEITGSKDPNNTGVYEIISVK